MSNLAVFPDLALAREEAAQWLARKDRGLTPEERATFDAWRSNPANARALNEMSALWNEMDSLQALAEVLPRPAPQAGRPASDGGGAEGSRRHGPFAALAASLLVGLIATGAYFSRDRLWSPDSAAPAPAQRHATAIGEQRSIAMEDGSVIALNTDSVIEVTPGGPTRELRLQRGEAHFTVAHDATRPFRVSVNGRVVQAIGTAFGVRLHDGMAVEVIVTEGRVKLLENESALVEQLGRGEVAWLGADNQPRITRLDGEALNERMAWRNGMLVFDGETLGTAIEEFSRYTPERIILVDPALRELRIGGYFPAGDTQALIEALRDNFGLDAHRDATGQIRIGPGTVESARSGTN
jgi:transmembrane sensor